ncbi:MAG TPA: 1-acyl-sn-glycerol-3-phosphate acyltransferase [Phnomibacter sp.]|nr:1-acyl-sn-glycerol-3-phosphate acyltransferase [Phnomibacter sp.]
MRWFWKIWLRANGWQIQGCLPDHLKKAVIIVAPHTSSMDFIVGVAVRSVRRMQYVRFLGKAELFKPPFGFIFRWLGGTPVYRSSQHNMVAQVVELFNSHENFIIALSPEGTRKKVERLRSGFYHIALQAKVPVVMAGLDFGKKQVVFSSPFMLSGNQQADFAKIISFFGPLQGKKPHLGLGHLLPHCNS